jgi:hypothetical protein
MPARPPKKTGFCGAGSKTPMSAASAAASINATVEIYVGRLGDRVPQRERGAPGPHQEVRLHKGREHCVAQIAIEIPQPRGLFGGELKTRHLEVLTPDLLHGLGKPVGMLLHASTVAWRDLDNATIV